MAQEKMLGNGQYIISMRLVQNPQHTNAEFVISFI